MQGKAKDTSMPMVLLLNTAKHLTSLHQAIRTMSKHVRLPKSSYLDLYERSSLVQVLDPGTVERVLLQHSMVAHA